MFKNPPLQENEHFAIIAWLFVCAFMVAFMMVIGAITRLSGSGLSMAEWRPFIGALPPLNAEEWMRVFDLYRETPEFEKKNSWMELPDFKRIFFWEWFHRLWGRLIGVVFAVPLLWFWVRGALPKGQSWKFAGAFVLGGAQGLMGWYMVKSGLVDVPAVSHFRLAAHLSLAFLILAVLLWLAMSLTRVRRYADRPLYLHAVCALLLVCCTIVWGAFTAGLDAGLVYNESFPKMGGAWLPPDFWHYDDVFSNIVSHHSAVQFTHRWLAIGTVLAVLSLLAHGVKRGISLPALYGAGGLVVGQAALGVATLFSGVALHVATAHQVGAIALFCMLTLCVYQLRLRA